jgi:transcriptional regulator with XRE-family HTH domain
LASLGEEKRGRGGRRNGCLQVFKKYVTVAHMKVRELGEFIREQRRNSRLTLRKLAEMAGVSDPYLSQIERGLRKPSAEILQAIAKGLRISAETLYVRAGILDDPKDFDLRVAIQKDKGLTPRQRQALIEIYESFRAEAKRSRRKAAAVEVTELRTG